MARRADVAQARLGNRRRRGPLALVMAIGLLLVLLVVGMAVRDGASLSRGSAAPVATPTIDPRLILRAQSVPVASALSHATRLSGTLSPAIPGRNTLCLAIHGSARAGSRGGRLLVVATMPGMAMAPIRATLLPHGSCYRGMLTLPMFGTYRARIVVDVPAGRATGTMPLVLPLPS